MAQPLGPSVLVATRDRPQALRRCLEALRAQSVKPCEIIVVDQGVEPLRPDHLDGLGVVLLRDEGVGLSRARNVAVGAVRSASVAVVDDDCVPDVGWLAALAAELTAEDRVDAVCGPVLPLPADGDRVFPVSSRRRMAPGDYTAGAVPWTVGTGGNFATRTALLRELGGYDCRLGAGSSSGAGEDVDLIYRMLRAGATIRYSPEALVRHERVGSVRRRATRRSYGRGIGAFIGIRAREGDPRVGLLLLYWVVQRVRRLARAAVRLDRRGLSEELMVLAGTTGGLWHGWQLRAGGQRT